MQNVQKISFLIVFVAMLFLPGCSVILGIFSAGIWAAIILVLLLVGLMFYGWSKNSGP